MLKKKLFIAGGAGVDIQAGAFRKINAHDSNPGMYSVSCGGVGRNVAVNAGLLGLDVSIMCSVGDDTYGRMIIDDLKSNGIDTGCVNIFENVETAAYVSLHEPDGEMYAAVSSMEINNSLTEKNASEKIGLINQCDACFAETNLSESVLEYLSAECRIKLFLDTVSEHKSVKVKNVIGRFHSIKPNIQEAEILCGFSINSRYELLKAADYFHGLGVENVFISMGKNGVLFSGSEYRGIAVYCNAEVKNVTGAGDAFIAGALRADIEGLSIRDQALWGTAASCMALASEESVNRNLSAEAVRKIVSSGRIDITEF